jgi:uncharacterized protein YndB with AHSA1/START domain
MSELTLITEGETDVVVTRRFAAPPEAVYRAHMEAELIQQWLLGPDGWTMPVCINEARPSGRIYYEWSNGKGRSFSQTGAYLEVEPYRRTLCVTRMHLPDPTPESRTETTFAADGGGTLMQLRMRVPDAQTRAAMIATGMASGMETSYARLEGMIDSFAV